MPNFEVDGKLYHNPVEYVLDNIGGRWKMPILWRLSIQSPWRYSELQKSISGISHKMLSQQLKELERAGFIHRKLYPVVPPKVEYRLTKKGELTIPAIEELRRLGKRLAAKSKTT